MPNSESCDQISQAVDGAAAGRIGRLQRIAAGGSVPDDITLRQTARDFASVFYGQVVKEMMQSVRNAGDDGDETEEDPMSGGVHDLVGMFLPQAISAQPGDPVVAYITDQLMDMNRRGGLLDESV